MSDLADIRERLARIETKLDVIADLEPRVSKLEKWRNMQAGAAALIGSIIGLFVKPHVGG